MDDIADLLTKLVPRTQVVCLGLSALDLVWSTDELFRGGGEKIRALDHVVLAGGMAATAAVTIARLGARAEFWGRAGDDTEGAQMTAAFVTEGVDVRAFRRFEGGRSSVSGIIVDAAGERQITNFRGRFPEDADWLPLCDVPNCSAVLADPRWVAGAEALFTAARAARVPTILDADVAEAEVFERLLPLTDHAIFSTPALLAFLPTHAADALVRVASYGCRVSAVTQGGGGVLWHEDGAVRRQHAFSVDVVDTTGAGDVFHGAYALALSVGLPPGEAMKVASAVAALKCTRQGGRDGIPTLEDSLAFLKVNA